MAVINVTKDDEWYTPKSLVDYFGKFDYDPATNEMKAKEFGLKHFDTIETDGLAQDWTKYRKIWINPPFTMKREFLEKAVETYRKTKAEIFLLFPVNFLVTKTFHALLGGVGVKIWLPDSRVKFESGNGRSESKSPAFGHVVVRLQEKWEIEPIKMEAIDGNN